MFKKSVLALAVAAVAYQPAAAEPFEITDAGSCSALMLYQSAPGFLSRDAQILLDGYFLGVATNRSRGDVLTSYNDVCLADPTKSVFDAMRFALEAYETARK